MTTDIPSLSPFKIPSIPSSIYYIPSFLSSSEQSHILSSLPPNRWIHLSRRRLQAQPSVLSKTNTLLASPLPKCLADPILARFEALGLFDASPHRTANHCLVNEYLPGQGIMPHEDGGAYFPIVATVSLGACVVLDVHDKRGEDDGDDDGGDGESGTREGGDDGGGGFRLPKWRILQEPGSLLVTTGGAYTDLLHGISEVEVDEDLSAETVANWHMLADAKAIIDAGGRNVRATRTSLTYRDVLKVSKVGSRILGKPRG